MPTTPNTIAYANISQYLASDSISKGSLFSTITNPELPTILLVENFFLNYLYTNDPSNTGLPALTNYVWGLCGAFGLTAQGIISGGGGSVTPVTPFIAPPPYQFEVSASSFMVTGDTSKTISNFIGYNLLFIRSNTTQSTVNTGGSYYSWNVTTGLFQIVGAAGEGELFQIYAV